MQDSNEKVKSTEEKTGTTSAESSSSDLLAANRNAYRELIRIASVLVQCHYLPSDLVDDYLQKTYSAVRVAKMMEKAHAQSKDLAASLRNIADRLSR